MKTCNRMIVFLAVLTLSGAALAHGGMGMMGAGDAKLSKEQFLKHAEERFTRMDANKDGVIDASDRAAMRKRMQDCMGMMHGEAPGASDGSGPDHEAQQPKP